MIQADATSILHDAIDTANQILPAEQQIAKARETRLFGPDAVLDSVGLITLIVELEERVESVTGRPIALTDERTLATRPSVFATVGSLTDYLDTLFKEASGG